MPNYAIMRIEKCKIGAVIKLNKHHEREKSEYKSNPDINTTQSVFNYHIVQPKKKYRDVALERIEEVGAKRRKDSVVMQDCLVTASRDWLHAKSEEEQFDYFRYAYAFFEQHFRKENIISAVVHLDEATPHMHLCFVPITEDNRLSSKQIIGGPKGLVEWQDKFYEYIHARYPDIDRGIPAKVSHRKHIPTFMFKVANELFDHYGEICNAINDIGLVGNTRKKNEAIALIGRYAPEMAQLKVQLASTNKHIKSLEDDLAYSRGNNKRLRNENYEQEVALEEANRSIYELNQRQKELEKKISMVPPDLLERLVREEKERRRYEKNRGDAR